MLQAAELDAVQIPSPAELFTVLNKTHPTATWNTQFRPRVPLSFSNRTQISINLGFVLTDCYLALEAQEGLQASLLSQDMLRLTQALGIETASLKNGTMLLPLAQERDWQGLRGALEATLQEIKIQLVQQRDNDMVTLISVGCWLRAVQIASALVEESYAPERTTVFLQRDIVDYLRTQIGELPDYMAHENAVRELSKTLEEIYPLVAFRTIEPPSAASVNRLNRYLTRFIKLASSR